MANCNSCKQSYKNALSDIPSKWRDQLVDLICSIKDNCCNGSGGEGTNGNNPSSAFCNAVKKCETLTSLSAFEVDDEQVCITYKDEHGVSVERCFNIVDIIGDDDCPCTEGLQYGGVVTWLQDYDYHISEAGYVINGTFYQSPEAFVTLAPSDPTFDRLDTFIVTTGSVATFLTGTPSANPVEPPLDIANQLRLSAALVQANTTEPEIEVECIYQEDIEWTTNPSTININPASTNNPSAGTVDVEFSSVVNGDYIDFVRSSSEDIQSLFTTLTFRIRAKSGWGLTSALQFQWYNGVSTVGNLVTVGDGDYGFDAGNFLSYQYIVLPLGLFGGFAGNNVDTLRITVSTAGTLNGLYLDNICMQQIELPPSASINTFQNGLRKFGNIVEFGAPSAGNGPGVLLHNTYLNTNYWQFFMTGNPVYGPTTLTEQIQGWQNGTDIATFKHKGSIWNTDPDYNQTAQFHIGYVGNNYDDALINYGYVDDRIGFLLGTNAGGNGSFGMHYDDADSKIASILFHTKDSNNDAITFLGDDAPGSGVYVYPLSTPGNTAIDTRILTLKTDKDIQAFGYPSSRDDGETLNALYVDADGNVKHGPIGATGTGPVITADSGLNKNSPNNVQLGTNPLLQATDIPTDGFTFRVGDTLSNGNDTLLTIDDSTQLTSLSKELQLSDYGAGTYAGSETFWLGVDGSGNVVELAAPSFSITADSGLTANTATNVRLGDSSAPGSALVGHRYIDAGALYSLVLTGTVPSGTADGVLIVNNTAGSGTTRGLKGTVASSSSSSYGVWGVATGGTGVRGDSTSSTGVYGNSTSGAGVVGVSSSTYGVTGSSVSSAGVNGTSTGGAAGGIFSTIAGSTNTFIETLQLNRGVTGTAAAGLGGYLSYNLQADGGLVHEAARIGAVWTDAVTASRTADLRFYTTNNTSAAKKASLKGSGQWQWDTYGVNTHTGTAATYAAFDSSGNVIEVSGINDGPVITADNGLTKNTATNIQWGGSLLQDTVITANGFNTDFIGTLNADYVVKVTNSGTGAATGLWGLSTNGNGIVGQSTNAAGGSFLGTNTWALTASSPLGAAQFLRPNPSGGGTVSTVINLETSVTGAVSNGFGGKISYTAEDSSGTTNLTNELISKWTNVTTGTRHSQFLITGVNSSVTTDIAAFDGAGVVGIGKFSSFTGTRLEIVDDSLAGASMVKLTSASTAATGNNHKLFEVLASGANGTSSQTTYGMYVSNTHTGTTSTNYGVYAIANSGSTLNTAVYGLSTDGTGVQGVSSSYRGVSGNSTSNYGVSGASTNSIGVYGESTNSIAAVFDVNPSSTNTEIDIVQFRRLTSGTPTAGIGARLAVHIEGGGSATEAGAFIFSFNDVTSSNEDADFRIATKTSGATTNKLEISSAGIFKLTQGLQDFADDTAAGGGGIPVNGLYRTGSAVKIRVS